MSPPLENGVVRIAGGRVVGVARAGSVRDEPVVDLGDVGLALGWVNAHAHLEFSRLPAPIGTPGTAFSRWIEQVVQWRRETQATTFAEAIRQGRQEAEASGTSVVADICSAPWHARFFDAAKTHPPWRPGDTVFLEAIGWRPDDIDRIRAELCAFLERREDSHLGVRLGISPHAPYTVSRQLLESLVEIAARHARPVAMHLGETEDEAEFLAQGTGGLAEMVERLGRGERPHWAAGTRFVDLLEVLAQAPRALVVHGNALGPKEWAFLAEQRDRMAVVHCPQTHTFFGRPPFALSRLLRAGVRVALGTDSRASSPDLSLLESMRQVRRNHADVAPATILALATVEGCRALGLAEEAAAIVPGAPARLVAVRLPARRDPYSFLEDDRPPQWIGGWARP